MDYLKLIEQRKSIRSFKEWTISLKQIHEIETYFSVCQRLVPEIDVELITFGSNAKEALDGVAGYQGYIIGAPYYLILLSDSGDHYLENAGFICEDMILKLTEMELDSCWITFQDGDAIKEALDIHSEKIPVAIIAYGYGKPEKEQTRLDIHNPSDVNVTTREGHIAPKISVEEMVHVEKWGQKAELDESLVDEGLSLAFYAASLSPTYLNRQPYRFILDSDIVVLVEQRDIMTDKMNSKLNDGVVMLNFGSVLAHWRPADTHWVFKRPDKNYELPTDYSIVGYCRI